MAEPQRYILLPKSGIRAIAGEARSALLNLPTASSLEGGVEAPFELAGDQTITVVDSVAEDGAKLVDMTEEAAERTNVATSPVRAVPIVYYDHPNPRLSPATLAASPLAAGFSTVKITCQDANSGSAVAGAEVVAFTDFAARRGAGGATDSSGEVDLRLENVGIERLYVYAPRGYWGAYRTSLSTTNDHVISLTPLDLSVPDSVRHYYGATRFNPGTGVKVGVIDSGCGPHGDLNLLGGRNTVTGEPSGDWHDGDTHGTHVAGLIGAGGALPTGLSGVAPDIGIYAYRVFGAGSPGASNYAILKAMIMAGMDGCDIINLSLGGGPFDDIVAEAVEDARQQGMLVVVAAGNDGRRRVNYPAAYAGAIAVSAMGRVGTFPTGSVETGDVLRPPSSVSEPDEFIAAFSNIGPEIALTGPGVGTLSTLPGGDYGPMSGTSMAAPVVAGAAASLLSQDLAVFGMPRDVTRAMAIEKLLQMNCIRRGFGSQFEGFGLPDPSVV